MPSSRILLNIAMLTAAPMAVPSAHRTARACEDIRAAAPARTDAANNVALVTGDGQQGAVATNAIACVAPNAACTS